MATAIVLAFVASGHVAAPSASAASAANSAGGQVSSATTSADEALFAPDCLSSETAEGTVAGVAPAATLVLADGRRVALADIAAPRAADGTGAAFEAALAERLAGRAVRIHLAGVATDRFGRLHGHVVLKDTGGWLQGALVAGGLAFVAPTAISTPCVTPLLGHESRARSGRAGLWREAMRPFSADDPGLSGHVGRFVLVEGAVLTIGRSRRNLYLNFGSDWSSDFTVIAAAGEAGRWQWSGGDWDGLAGRRVRVRGHLEAWNGPLIRVEHPGQIELLPADVH